MSCFTPSPGLPRSQALSTALVFTGCHSPWWLEELQGHRALAPGSAVSEVTGGTPVLCK